MAESEFKILVATELAPNSLSTLQSQLNSMNGGKPIEIKAQISQKVFDQIKQLKQQLTELSKIEINFGKPTGNTSFSQFATDLKTSSQGLKNAVNEINKANQQMQKIQRQTVNTTQQLNLSKQNMSLQMDVWLKRNSAAASQFGQRITQLQSELKTCDATRLNGIRAEFQAITREATLAGKNVQTFGDRLKAQFQKFSSYITVAMIFSKVAQGLRSMYNNVLSVDTAMTQLYRVTDLTAAQYRTLFKEMTASAKEYGTALDSIINSTASWVRLGFNTKEATRLSEISTMYQHVTDLDESTAVKNLVTAYKGFEKQLKEAFNGDAAAAVERISDIYDRLGNKFAEFAADVGEGLSKAAAVLSEGGASLEEAAGMFTGIQEVLQDASTSGSTLKILTMRIRGMKGELQELGEEVDENVESISKMQTQILNLTHGQVNIFDDLGNFRDIYDIMSDIAEIYDDLTDTDRASLLEVLAGKNRSVGVAALLQNWESVEKATEEAYQAAGTAQEEQDKWMNSMQGHLNQLKTAWQGLSNDFLNSSFLKGVFDILTGIVNTVDAIVNTIGVIPTLGIGTAITAFIRNLD